MSQSRGQLWVIDGADGVGKATQAKLLIDRLNRSQKLGQHLAHHVAFPHYDEPWGKIVRQHLDGQFGDLDSLGPHGSSLAYIGDRATHAPHMHTKLESGHWIICDRYTQSNMAFQAAKITGEAEKQRYLDWLIQTEYELFNIPKPDGVIVLTLPLAISQRRTEERRAAAQKHGEKMDGKTSTTDIHEQNGAFMARVMDQYVALAQTFGWHVVDCAPDHELTREELSDAIWHIIEQAL